MLVVGALLLKMMGSTAADGVALGGARLYMQATICAIERTTLVVMRPKTMRLATVELMPMRAA